MVSRWRALLDWRVAFAVSALAHVLLLAARVDLSDGPQQPLEFIDFEIAPPIEEPEVVPEPPPEEEAPAGPENPDPEADPEVTSIESNREPEPDAPEEPVPLVTGVALEVEQLTPVGGMAVRVGNTTASGFDADVEPGDLKGFEGDGAGGDGSGSGAGRFRKAELMRAFEPPYPHGLAAQGIMGHVLLRVEVLETGRAGKVEVITPVHPELDRAALAAVKRFRWRPARSGGEKAASTMLIEVRFRIDG